MINPVLITLSLLILTNAVKFESYQDDFEQKRYSLEKEDSDNYYHVAPIEIFNPLAILRYIQEWKRLNMGYYRFLDD